MPNDLYQWESAGGLVHHCPICFKPLTTPQARSRCLGEHVEWCKQYHTQLFKKGSSGQCRPCRHSDEEHDKRHREIAELVHELKYIKLEQSTSTSMTPKTTNVISDSPMTKKERKAAKKAQKGLGRPKVCAADVELIANILHPHDTVGDEDKEERRLLEDPDIKLNRFFHKGTSNRREIRNRFVSKDRQNSKLELLIEAEELEGILQLLNVSPAATKSSPEEKAIVAKLRDAIEKDLVHVHKELEMTMMRKAGFWRWASKKAYNRLLQNGRIWSEKGADTPTATTETANSSSSACSGTDADTETTEADTDITTPSEEDDLTDAVSNIMINTPSRSKDVFSSGPFDDGWTTVGNPSKLKPKKTIGPLKLVSNGGLAKLVQSPTPKLRAFAGLCEEDEE